MFRTQLVQVPPCFALNLQHSFFTSHKHGTMAPQSWLITGCSSGFGAEFIHQLRALGDNAIATGRNAETRLAHLKDSGASILDLNVTAPEDVIATKMEEAWSLYPGSIDVVVNNAGYILSAAGVHCPGIRAGCCRKRARRLNESRCTDDRPDQGYWDGRGRTIPPRISLGTDGWTRMKEKCEATLTICHDWEDVAKSTDVQK